jgi:hypothetical protein
VSTVSEFLKPGSSDHSESLPPQFSAAVMCHEDVGHLRDVSRGQSKVTGRRDI